MPAKGRSRTHQGGESAAAARRSSAGAEGRAHHQDTPTAKVTSTENIQGGSGSCGGQPVALGSQGGQLRRQCQPKQEGIQETTLGENLRRQLESKARAVCQLPWEDARGGYCRLVSVSGERRRSGAWQRRKPVLQWTTRRGATAVRSRAQLEGRGAGRLRN